MSLFAARTVSDIKSDVFCGTLDTRKQRLSYIPGLVCVVDNFKQSAVPKKADP